jgi:lantibiotic biosynthesis protein
MEPLSFVMKIHSNLIVRTPLRAIDTSFGEDEIVALLHETWFREAIYIASPSLYNACEELAAGKMMSTDKRKKIIQSLAKYYIRMTGRCTPFGLFAACSYASWGDSTSIRVRNRPVRRTRLDMYFLCRLVKELEQNKNVQNSLQYFPNSSVYYLGDEIRYIETIYANDRRTYRISAVDKNDYTADILGQAATGATISQLCDHLLQYEVGMEEANEFVGMLIASGLLVPEWEPAITGKEYMFQVIETLERIPDPAVRYITDLLKNIEAQLQELDKNNINEPAQYRAITELIKLLGVPFEEEKIFQVDAVQGIDEESTVDSSLQESLYDALYLFENIIPDAGSTQLEQFKKRFRERYEDREVLLAEALDTEMGIGFGETDNMQQESPLLDGLVLPAAGAENARSISTWEHYWLKYLVKAQKENKYIITLTETEVEELRTKGAGWAPSVSASFRLTAHGKIFVEYIGGSSAVNLAGRFTYAGKRIHEMVNDITCAENQNNEEVILAEILHMPESRTGNVLQHRACRQYEIPYLARAAAGGSSTITINDLWVSVIDDRIILRSKKLGREIIPRLSNAHNFGTTALPIYNFLCQMQTQQLRSGASFSFGAAENYFKFLPRVEYKNCIVHPATWLLDKKEIEKLTEVAEQEQCGAFSIFNVSWNLPRYFVLADGDNELLVDSGNALLLQSFIRLIKNRHFVKLTEYLGSGSKGIADAAGRKYNAQFIAMMVRETAVYKAVSLPVATNLPIRFMPGSEWMYVKLYCGFKTAERIIAEMIAPLAATWQQQGLVSKWFFIRYQDPRFHLRVRLLLAEPEYTGKMMEDLRKAVAGFSVANAVSKVQLDTYEREAKRYGYDTMELSESIFYHDSVAVAGFLQSGAGTEEMRWIWAARVIRDLAEDVGWSDLQKVEFLQHCRDRYAQEFGAGPETKKQLDKKYRSLSSRLYTSLQQPADPVLENLLQKRRSLLKPVVDQVLQYRHAGRSMPSLEDFLASHIHMMLNRVFMADARMQEWVLYDFLTRHYQSVIARTNQRRVMPVD